MPQPEHGIVQILNDGQCAIGLGFVVGRRQVVTCAHVVNSALGRAQRDASPPSAQPIWLRFPFSGEEVVRLARVAVWTPRPDEVFELTDVCGLVLPEPMPEPAWPLTFADEGGSPSAVQMWGPSPLRETGGHVTGELMGAVDAVRLQVDQRVGGVFAARVGFSGGPVWNRATGQVVGMLQAVGREDVYVIRPEVLVRAWPDVLFRPPPSPYVGLRSFGTDDQEVFFGREEFVSALVEDAARIPLIVVMGPSGSGKSSTIDAGLVPRLTAQGSTAVVRMRPGRQPMRALAWAMWPTEDLDAGVAKLRARGLRYCVGQFLGQAGLKRCVIVVDQGEELITRAVEGGFLDLLSELIDPESVAGKPSDIVVALSVRAEYFGQLLVAHERIGDYVREHARTLRQMSESELRAAISQPLLRTPPPRVAIRDSLVDQLCADFRGRPAELPLLQFALTRLWEAQRDGELTLESYHRIGGTAALARYADERAALLSEAELAAARRILTGLVLPGTEDVGRPVARSELRSGDWPVVERLEQDRLVVTWGPGRQGAEPTVEIAHEALLRGWARLREWLHDNHEFREWRHSTALLQNAWLENSRDPSLLLRGPVLARAEAMISSYPEDTHKVRPFVEDSRGTQDAEERHRKELTARAEALHLSARAELAAATSHLGMEKALLLDICSLRRFPTVEAERALHRRASASTVLLSRFQGSNDNYVSLLAFHPRANILAAADGAANVRVWDLSTGGELHCFPKAKFTRVTALDFDAEGARLAIGFQYLDTEVWDVATGRQLNRLAIEGTFDGSVEGLAFHPDGTRLATGGDQNVRIWDLAKPRGKEIRRFEHRANAVAFGPDGTLLATGGIDSTARVWDLATGSEVHRLEHENEVTGVGFPPEENRLVTVSAYAHGRPDTMSRVWDLSTGQAISHLAFDGSVSGDVAFHLNSNTAATHSTDQTARVWDLSSGEELHRLIHDSPVYAVAFDPEGQHAATGTYDGAILLWDLAARLETFTAASDRWFDDMSFHPDGTMVTGACYNSARVWDLRLGEELDPLESAEIFSVALAPTGTRLAIGTRAASVWDLETRQELHRFPHGSVVNGVAFHPDGTLLASCSSDGSARLWDLETGREVVRLQHDIGAGHGNEDWDDDTAGVTVSAVCFDRAGGRLATASDNSARVWQLPEGGETYQLTHPRVVHDVSFHPQGISLATACEDGIVRVWDLETGAEAHGFTTDGTLYSVAFDANGIRLAAGGYGTSYVWDLETREETHRLYSTGYVRAVAFDSTGTRLATADKAVHVWDLRTETLIEQARARLTRNLTPEEWQRYMPGQPYEKFRDDLP
jgi:WD40 repeat protein